MQIGYKKEKLAKKSLPAFLIIKPLINTQDFALNIQVN